MPEVFRHSANLVMNAARRWCLFCRKTPVGMLTAIRITIVWLRSYRLIAPFVIDGFPDRPKSVTMEVTAALLPTA